VSGMWSLRALIATVVLLLMWREDQASREAADRYGSGTTCHGGCARRSSGSYVREEVSNEGPLIKRL
jgi:hypothetical protein